DFRVNRFLDYGYGRTAALSPDGKRIAIVRPASLASRQEQIKLCTVDDGIEFGSLTLNDQVRAIKLSPDGHLLAVGTGDGLVKLWESATREIKTLKHGELPIPSLAFSSDLQWLATGDSAGVIKLWKLANLAEAPLILPQQGGQVWSLAFLSTSNVLACG